MPALCAGGVRRLRGKIGATLAAAPLLGLGALAGGARRRRRLHERLCHAGADLSPTATNAAARRRRHAVPDQPAPRRLSAAPAALQRTGNCASWPRARPTTWSAGTTSPMTAHPGRRRWRSSRRRATPRTRRSFSIGAEHRLGNRRIRDTGRHRGRLDGRLRRTARSSSPANIATPASASPRRVPPRIRTAGSAGATYAIEFGACAERPRPRLLARGGAARDRLRRPPPRPGRRPRRCRAPASTSARGSASRARRSS